ncbi:FtsX-like permease family protein [Streptomyces rubiginosohelvolus]|uniref:ABC transporter permease n=1 Tax=Streptomyces rubiginosohelvolus TaxID=67362 RepID=UPI00341AFF1D
MRATLRWAHSDLLTHRGQASFIVGATAGIVTALLLAAALFGYATNPWQRVFTQSHSAHVWIRSTLSATPGQLASQDGVDALAGPFRTAVATVETRGARAAVELRAVGEKPPVTGRPLITAGQWLSPSAPDGVVLESSLARALWVEPGDRLTVPGGGSRPLTVLGLADSAEPRYRPGERRGIMWALPTAAEKAGGAWSGQVTGMRLTEQDDTDYAIQRAVTALGSDAVTEVSSWQQARDEAQGDTRLLGQVLALFGLGALAAAALAVFGAISTRVRGHLRDISVLKAVGFTPGQVVRVFLVQHLGLALLGALIATVLTGAFGARIPGRLGEAVNVWQGLPGQRWALLAVPVGAVLFIGAATSLAAWRAGRVPPVPVLPPERAASGTLSRSARRILGLGVPPALVLGWHRALVPGRRTVATIARLALPLVLITVALSAWTTMSRFESEPERMGTAAQLTVRAEQGMSAPEVRSLLDADDRIMAAHPGVEVAALVPGQTVTIALRGLGTSGDDPYPYAVVEGRLARGPDEAVAGQGLLDLLDVRIGDWVRLTAGEHPQILHIVGRSIEHENAGRVISTSLDTLRQNDPGLSPTLHQLRLASGADLAEVREVLMSSSGGRLDIQEITTPVDRFSSILGMVAGLVAVLALIGLIELSTAIGGSVLAGERDVLALKAIGFSPGQITAISVTSIGCTTLFAAVTGVVIGVPVGSALIDSEARAIGIGSGVAQAPTLPHLGLLVTVAVLGAVALSILPAAGPQTRSARSAENA